MCWTGLYCITTNYRVRALGLPKTGEARLYAPVCPSMAFVPASMARYRAASRRWLRVFQSFPGVVVQKRGIDEAYIDVTEAVRARIRKGPPRSIQPHPDPASLLTLAARRHAAAEAKWRAEEAALLSSPSPPSADLLESSGSLRAGLEGSLSSDPITQWRENGTGERYKGGQMGKKEVKLDEKVKAMTEEEIEAMCTRLHPLDHCRASVGQMQAIEPVAGGEGREQGKVDGMHHLPWVGQVLMAGDGEPGCWEGANGSDEESSADEADNEPSLSSFTLPAAHPPPPAQRPPPPPLTPAVVDPPPIDFSLEDPEHPSDDHLLMVGSQLAFELRLSLFLQTGLTTSAGIALNPMLAKLASSLHKPNQQSIVRAPITRAFIAPFKLSKVSGFGPKAVAAAASHHLHTIADIQARSYAELAEAMGGAMARRLWAIAEGEDGTVVEATGPPKSINQSKRMPTVTGGERRRMVRWLAERVWERVVEDVGEYGRWPTLLVVAWVEKWGTGTVSRRVGLPGLEGRRGEEVVELLYALGLGVVERHVKEGVRLASMALQVERFVPRAATPISTFLTSTPHRSPSPSSSPPPATTDADIDALFLLPSDASPPPPPKRAKRTTTRGTLDRYLALTPPRPTQAAAAEPRRGAAPTSPAG